MVTVEEILIPLIAIGMSIGIAAIAGMWNLSRKITSLELNNTQVKSDYVKDLSSIEKKHLEDVKALENEIQRQVGERKDDMLNSSMNRKDELTGLQSQLSGIRSQLKDVDNRVTIVDTKVKTHDENIINLNERIDKNIEFFTTWVQRVENRIEDAQNRLSGVISDAKRELMGTINMLINYGAAQTSLKKNDK